MKIDNGPKPTNVFNEIDADKDGFITRKEVSTLKTSVKYVMLTKSAYCSYKFVLINLYFYILFILDSFQVFVSTIMLHAL